MALLGFSGLLARAAGRGARGAAAGTSARRGASSSGSASGSAGWPGGTAVALALGAAGAVPFVGLTPGGAKVLGELVPPGAPGGSVVAWATSRERRVPLQVSYGASILSFLGAMHWGLAMAGGVRHGALRFAWSVVPSLVAWPCAALPPCVGLQVSAGGLLAAAAVDLALFRTCSSLPAWYVAGLRVPLTTVAVGSLGASLVAEGTEGQAGGGHIGAV